MPLGSPLRAPRAAGMARGTVAPLAPTTPTAQSCNWRNKMALELKLLQLVIPVASLSSRAKLARNIMNPQWGCKPCPYAAPEFVFTYKSHVQWIHGGSSCHSPLPGIIRFLHTWEGQEYKICVEMKIHSNFYSFLLNISHEAASACQK